MTLQSMGAEAASDEIGRTIAGLAPWFHNLHLPSGHQTAPDHPLGDYPAYKWQRFGTHLPVDLTGWSVLDIGCNAGTYAFALAERGAHVLAVDHDEHYLRQARWARDLFGLTDRVELERRSVYDLADLGETFDLVLFLGVLYHLRYPTLALDLVAEKVGKLLVVQTLSLPGEEVVTAPANVGFNDRDLLLQPGWPSMSFVEHRLADDPTNWWVPNRAAVEAMLRSAGLRVTARPDEDVYVCERSVANPHQAELDAALRRMGGAS